MRESMRVSVSLMPSIEYLIASDAHAWEEGVGYQGDPLRVEYFSMRFLFVLGAEHWAYCYQDLARVTYGCYLHR